MALFWRTLRTIFYKLAVSVIALLSGIIVTRYLTVGERGIYTETTTALLLGSSYLAGYSNFFNYGINRLKYDKQTVYGVLLRQYLFICGGLAILLVLALFGIHFDALFLYAAIILFTLPFTLFLAFSTKLINALNQIDLLNRLNMMQNSLMFTFALFLFITVKVWWHGNHPLALSLTLLGWTVSFVLAAMIAMRASLKACDVQLRIIKNTEISRRLNDYGHKISLQNFLTLLNYRGDLFFVGILAGSTVLERNTSAGLYGIAVSASEVLWQVSQSISLMVYSRVAAEERDHSTALTEKTFRYIFWSLILLALVMAALSFMVPIVYGAKYERSIPAFNVLLIGTAAYGTTGLLTQYFTDQLGKVKYPVYMQIASIATNALICVLLIPHIGLIGGAIASSSAYVVALVMSLAYFRYHSKRSLRHLFIFTKDDLHRLSGFVSRARRVHQS